MKIINLIIGTSFLFANGVAHSEITRSVDSFDGRIFITSKIRHSDDIEHNYTGSVSDINSFKSNSIRGDFNELEFYKVKTAQNSVAYMLRVHGNNSDYYSSINSSAIFNVDGSFLNLPSRWDQTSIRRYYIEMDSVIPFLTDGSPHDISLRLSTGGYAYTVKINDRIKSEWLQLIQSDFNDAILSNIKPIGGDTYIVGKTATGWAVDLRSREHQPEIHVYRGNNPLFSIRASGDRCREMGIVGMNYQTSKEYPCNLLGSDILSEWRKWVYNFDLNQISGASVDPIRLIAINSVAGMPPTELSSKKMILKDDIECVYNWAEHILTDIIPEKVSTADEGAYRVRRYSNGAMLATIFGSGDFSFQLPGGPVTNGGNLSSFLPDAISMQCGK